MPKEISSMTYSSQTDIAEPAFMQLLESAPDAMIIVGEDGNIVVANSQATKLFGYSKTEFAGKKLELLLPEKFRRNHGGHRTEYFHNPLVRPMGAALDLFGLNKNGVEFPVEISLSPLKTNQGTFVISAIRDVTERHLIEDKIRASLREKEILLREIHHRVKNNLQIVSSIINLQAQQMEPGMMRESLEDIRARVRSIALVHERLYESNDFVNIKFHEYVEGLLSDLFEAYGSRSEGIEMKLDIQPVSLDIDKTINCGLIITELASNSLKYAFLEKRGKIEVSFTKEGNTYSLTVRDNGKGLPAELSKKKEKSLGLNLVDGLSRELGGKVIINSEKGAMFQINFPQ